MPCLCAPLLGLPKLSCIACIQDPHLGLFLSFCTLKACSTNFMCCFCAVATGAGLEELPAAPLKKPRQVALLVEPDGTMAACALRLTALSQELPEMVSADASSSCEPASAHIHLHLHALSVCGGRLRNY